MVQIHYFHLAKVIPYSENNFSEYHDTKYALQQLIEHSKFISHSVHVTYRLFMEARRRLNGLRGQRRNIPRRGLFIVSRESFVVPLQETASQLFFEVTQW